MFNADLTLLFDLHNKPRVDRASLGEIWFIAKIVNFLDILRVEIGFGVFYSILNVFEMCLLDVFFFDV